MRATHLCGERFEGTGEQVQRDVAEHKQACAAEHRYAVERTGAPILVDVDQ